MVTALVAADVSLDLDVHAEVDRRHDVQLRLPLQSAAFRWAMTLLCPRMVFLV
jgi:hypothetical protein